MVQVVCDEGMLCWGFDLGQCGHLWRRQAAAEGKKVWEMTRGGFGVSKHRKQSLRRTQKGQHLPLGRWSGSTGIAPCCSIPAVLRTLHCLLTHRSDVLYGWLALLPSSTDESSPSFSPGLLHSEFLESKTPSGSHYMEISSAGSHKQSTNAQSQGQTEGLPSPASEQQPDKAHVCCKPKKGSADGKNLVSTFLARPFLPAASHSSGVPGEILHPAASAPATQASGTLTSEVLHQHSPTKGPSLMLTASGPGWSRALSWICQLLVVQG